MFDVQHTAIVYGEDKIDQLSYKSEHDKHNEGLWLTELLFPCIVGNRYVKYKAHTK